MPGEWSVEVAGSDGVSWKELHDELRERDKIADARLQHLADKIDATYQDFAERDDRHTSLLMEIRDSLGDMHTTLVSLKCDEEAARLVRLTADMETLRQRTIDWRAGVKKLQPIFNPKMLGAAILALAGALGWHDLQGLLSKFH